MLEILSLELLPDGRSFVDAVGGSRFKVLKRGQRDGYHTADIEYLEDLKVKGRRDHSLNIHTENMMTSSQDLFPLSTSCLRVLSFRLMEVSWSFWSVSMTACTSRLRTGTSASAAAFVNRSTDSTAPCQIRRKTFRSEAEHKRGSY